MFTRLVLLGAVFAVGYWYWTGPYQQRQQVDAGDQLERNAFNMERCIRRESSENTAAGLAIGGGSVKDARDICASSLGLYFDEGQWRKTE